MDMLSGVPKKQIEDGVNIIRSAFEDGLMSDRATPLNDNHVKVLEFMAEFKNKICMLITKKVRKHLSVKINMELFGLYDLKQQEVVEINYYQTKYEIVSVGVNCEELYDKYIHTGPERV
ncbi:hypothetical protein FQA39_LY19040 [Lamprigera yunnana]|nr:hypothetical protein FQA39_LY19040 [Lamprigera yunnana]